MKYDTKTYTYDTTYDTKKSCNLLNIDLNPFHTRQKFNTKFVQPYKYHDIGIFFSKTH